MARIIRGILGCGGSQGRKGGRVDSGSGIDLLNLSCIETCRCHTVATGICAVSVVEDAFAQTGQRHNFGDRLRSGLATTFVAVEEEKLILEYRTAQGASECVADKFCTRDTGLVAEPVVGFEQAAAIELERRSVPLVTSALGNQAYLCGRRTAFVGVGVDRSDAKLLDGFRVEAKDSAVDVVALSVVDIYAVKRDVGLVAAGPGD